MFTEALITTTLSTLKWGSGQQTKEVPCSILHGRSRINPIVSIRTGGRNVGLPPPLKFSSGNKTQKPEPSQNLTAQVGCHLQCKRWRSHSHDAPVNICNPSFSQIFNCQVLLDK
ncbi:hypothetical protein P3S68_027354 [Capsicum galapagoense]